MKPAIDTVFIDTILIPLLRELGLPETSPRMQKWVFDEATGRDVTLDIRSVGTATL